MRIFNVRSILLLRGQPRMLRTLGNLLIVIVVVFIIREIRSLLNGNYSKSSLLASSYSPYVDQNGMFRPYVGYRFIHPVLEPFPNPLDRLYDHLDQTAELKEYFVLVPKSSYHVPLTILTNDTSQIYIYMTALKKAQQLIDEDKTETVCIGQSVIFVDNQEIRLIVEYKKDFLDKKLQPCQERWKEYVPDLIVQNCSSFYITLAYQYRQMPNDDVINRLNQQIKLWSDMPIVDIKLAPVEISHHTNAVAFQPLIP